MVRVLAFTLKLIRMFEGALALLVQGVEHVVTSDMYLAASGHRSPPVSVVT